MDSKSYTYEYARPSVTVDCVIFCKEADALKVLLIERKFPPYKGCWALPGGFMNMDEDAETAAKRELQEETGVVVEQLKQCGAFTDVDRDPRERVVTIAYYALIEKTDTKAADDAKKAEWLPIDSLPPLAFDHDKILQAALKAIAFDSIILPNTLTLW
ncbi:MAG: NUDIX hydrolase [Bacteroidales bacterium]|nr:NUDIX hydrolase [Bacteroidales bacterium]